MTRFTFQFESLLTLRRSQRDGCQQAFAAALRRLDELRTERLDVEHRRQEQIEEMRQLGEAGDVDVDGTSRRRYFASQLIADIAQLERQRIAAEKEALARRQALLHADQAVQSLEKLEARHRAEFAAEWERRTQRELEDLWQASHTGDRR